MEHNNKFMHVADRYNYIDKSSWEAADRVNITHAELISIFDSAQSVDKQMQLDIAVLAFHYIWNQQNLQLAQQMLKLLLTSGAENLYTFYYFLESKRCHFIGDHHLSLELLAKAEEGLVSGMNGSPDYRKLLTCIGSINDTDPLGIEYNVMKAIISNDKGNNYHAMGMHDQAINAFMEALNLQSKSYSTMSHANIAYTRRCMAKSLEAKGRHHEASEQYNLANKIAEDVYNDTSHPEAIEISRRGQVSP